MSGSNKTSITVRVVIALACISMLSACASTRFTSEPPGAFVRLSTVPAPGFRFAFWTGCDSVDPREPDCGVVMDRNQIIEATFEPIP